MQGDISLSAGDNPASMASLRVPAVQLPSANHGGEPDDEPEEHRDWLQGHTAVKFLLAGGIAGAGEAFAVHKRCLLTLVLAGSFEDMYRTV